ncbi:transposable element Tcb2 transposase [Trichonephila clavipes]|uniref:Transposable element Tcb2 transposase n=1 Tax=Trichonephila clavipes TaxID=2585209 RepID=A0A8X6VFH3_TRICX|nr:transposable element Tcb2 transposase [Trichonephila clavipes]
MIDERLARHRTPVTTFEELWLHVEAAWASVPVHAIQSLFDSMPRRICAVSTARGVVPGSDFSGSGRGHLTSFSEEYKTGKSAESLTKIDMPLCRFRRQYEQISQFETERIIGMMEAGCSARRVARQLGHCDCVVRRCWDQWIREM